MEHSTRAPLGALILLLALMLPAGAAQETPAPSAAEPADLTLAPLEAIPCDADGDTMSPSHEDGAQAGAPLEPAARPDTEGESDDGQDSSYPNHQDPIPGEWEIRRPAAGEPGPSVALDGPDGREQRYWYDSFNGRVRVEDHDVAVQALELQFLRLVEYTDGDGNELLDDGDEIQATYTIKHLPHLARAAETGCSLVLQWRYGLGGPPAEPGTPLLIIDFRHSTAHGETPPSSEEPAPSAERTKIDITIQGYRAAAPTSRLAVVHQLLGSVPLQMTPASGAEPGLQGQADDGRRPVGYSWAPTAEVDGRVVPVRSTSTQQSAFGESGLAASSWEIVFNYPTGGFVLHDPHLGAFTVASMEVLPVAISSLPQAVALLVGATLGSCLLAVLYVTRRRSA